jgi:hypothetical protein
MIKQSSCRCCHLPRKLLLGASCLVAALVAARLEKTWGLAEEAPESASLSATTSSGYPTGPFDGFRQLFTKANPDASLGPSWSERTRFTVADLPLVLQMLFRLRQVETDQLERWTQPAPPLAAWRDDPAGHRAELAWINGKLRSLEEIKLPDSVARAHPIERLYQCQLEIEPEQVPATVIAANVPKGWLVPGTLPQPVRLRGLFLRTWPGVTGEALLLLTSHLVWFPTERAPPGLLFLAAHGMDVALLDEVQQRQPFVKPGISHESAAFYACLAATNQAEPGELSNLARRHLPAVAGYWRQARAESNQQRQALQQKISAAGSEASRDLRVLPRLEREQKAANRRVALASAVLLRARQNQYSIAPLFLEPHKQVGSLTMVEGVARRAIKIMLATDHPPMAAMQAVKEQDTKVEQLQAAQPAADGSADVHQAGASRSYPDDSATPQNTPSGGLEDPACYYELEIFTADSQNLPVVCCVSRLPAHFPLGDAIREPVRVAGVFFKSWLYRTRQTKDHNKVGRQQRLSVPIVIGAEVERLPAPSFKARRWPLVAGIGFLVLLAAFWATAIRHARRERLLRTSRLPATGLPRQWPDTFEDRSPR